MRKFVLASLFVLFATAFAAPARADTISFDCISSGASTDCAILESQMFVDIQPFGGDDVTFLFYNTGPLASSITDIYFSDDDNKLGTFEGFGFSSGVSFQLGCSPMNPPGANSFNTTDCVSSTSPTAPNGIGPLESAVLIYDLNDSFNFAMLMSEISDGSFGIGIKVQGFADGGSVTGLNNPPGNPTPVPEPGSTLSLISMGLLGLGAMKRKLTNRKTISA